MLFLTLTLNAKVVSLMNPSIKTTQTQLVQRGGQSVQNPVLQPRELPREEFLHCP